MNKSIVSVLLLLFVCATLLFSGCSQEEAFSVDPMEDLHFSADTLSFDTIFSTLGTPTAWLKVYNTGKKKIQISGISLKSGGINGYRINVDGISARTFSNVEILPHDSLFLFVELTPSKQNSDKPSFVDDAIVFQTDDKMKQIVLEAYSQDVTIWHGKTITSDTILTSGKPFLIYDSLVVSKNVTLRIQEGTTLYFHDKAKVVVHGTIKANGTVASPITFRGDRLDQILTNFSYDDNPGQWESVYLTESSYNNEFDFVHIRGANYGLIADSSSMDRIKLKMTNSIIHNMTKYCILSCNCKMSIANSQMTNSGLNTLYLIGGEYDFIHCTIANYQNLVTREGAALLLANYLPASGGKDILYSLKSDFYNCIVFGSHEIEVDTMFTNQTSWKIQFTNCLLRSRQWSPDIATNCIYSTDVKFLKLGSEEEKYRYDFRIDSLSTARNKADVLYSKLYPYDMNGVSRFSDGLPDIGAYEWISGKNN